MPITPTYPGVYVQEISSGVRTITGVATSIAAFVDYFVQGPMDEAVQILSFADFERQFGGLDGNSEASYAINQFFLNGGPEAYVVRVTSGTSKNAAASAAIVLMDAASGGSNLLLVTASSAGKWGNNIRVDVDYGTTDPATSFNLTVTEISLVNGQPQVIATENYRNLVIDPAQSNDAAAVVNSASQLIQISSLSGSTGKRPAQTGTTSKQSPDLTAVKGLTMDVTLNGTKVGTTAALPDPGAGGYTYASLAAAIQSAIRAVDPSLAGVTVTSVGTAAKSFLIAKAGTGNWGDVLALSDAGAGLATALGVNAKSENVQQYALGAKAAGAQATPTGGQQSGSDGKWDPAGDSAGIAQGLIGDPAKKTGMYALLDVDLFNILCIPATMNLSDTTAAQVATDATALCTQRRAFYILDVPQGSGGQRDKPDGILAWMAANDTLRSRNAAVYFPRVDLADPLNGFRLRPTAPSGTVAGLYARIDANRGVWKAPAGTEATLAGVQSLEYKLTDGENGVLNPLALNALRNFPVYGSVCWGARTLEGADQLADDYKYIPVRRLALYIEESLFRGTQWVVFEPNDEPLWAQIRLNVGAFMHNLFRQGAFQGSTPQDAYFVLCDKTTNPQFNINQGIVTISVGFAPLKPAEFVIIQIQQMAGQIAT